MPEDCCVAVGRGIEVTPGGKVGSAVGLGFEVAAVSALGVVMDVGRRVPEAVGELFRAGVELGSVVTVANRVGPAVAVNMLSDSGVIVAVDPPAVRSGVSKGDWTLSAITVSEGWGACGRATVVEVKPSTVAGDASNDMVWRGTELAAPARAGLAGLLLVG